MARSIRLILSCLCATVLQACNPFVDHYSGTRFPPGSMAQLVESAPANVTQIGESVFETSEQCTSKEALTAAQKLGAQYVVFEEVDLGERESWEQTTMMTRAGASGGTMAVNVPVPVTRNWHEYRATFYREADELNEEKQTSK